MLLSVVLVGLTAAWIIVWGTRRRKGLPPGPPVLPILGNIHLFPKKWPHYQFTKWAREYGPIFALQMMHQTIIVLNTPSAIRDVIERKSLSTSNRPESHIAAMIIPNNENFGMATHLHGNWKTLRRVAMYMLKAENMDKYKELQYAEAAQLMYEMMTNPTNFYEDISRFTTSFIMSVLYGHRAPRSSTSEAAEFTKLQLDFMYVVDLGKAPPVDLFPILKYVPERFAKWKRNALDVKRRQEALFGRLTDMVKRRVDAGKGNGSFMEEAYIKRKEWGLESDSLFRNLGGALLEASDTSSALLQVVILMLVAYPETQKKAQEEIDEVVGPDRPPTFSDLPKLKYMSAVIEETLRFRPIAPLALPHAMDKDEIINGMFFPKGAVVFMNLWAVFHDPQYYDEPDRFIPERFLKHPLGVRPDVQDDPARKENLAFGGGRRVCPGTRTGKASVEINLANLLWAFNFTPARNPETGALEPPDIWNVSEGVNATPMFFRCTVELRSENKRNIIAKHHLFTSAQFEPYEQDLTPADKEFVTAEREYLTHNI
ncbi:cytochrome P450 [Fistulina hepatica ATCC 64428]|uniref:Cytochrome P450 n=1 Tax=Fistulina hepatica ATCC 64428 TaxID=1128425 RepID=A0A0D7AHH2_9AGAR|nr:cytochrome P450 [Fistulina hepatica ATCC 64428]